MAYIRDLLLNASQVNKGEMTSYISITKYRELIGGVDLDTLKIQSETKAGAIVLLCDHILANKRKNRPNRNLYECMQKGLEEDEAENDKPFTDDVKLEYLISYFFEDDSEIVLKEDNRKVLLSF